MKTLLCFIEHSDMSQDGASMENWQFLKQFLANYFEQKNLYQILEEI